MNPIFVKVLELLSTWRSELCEKSRYKSDLMMINEMCKLLKAKGRQPHQPLHLWAA